MEGRGGEGRGGEGRRGEARRGEGRRGKRRGGWGRRGKEGGGGMTVIHNNGTTMFNNVSQHFIGSTPNNGA